jgi:hypothetical protein
MRLKAVVSIVIGFLPLALLAEPPAGQQQDGRPGPAGRGGPRGPRWGQPPDDAEDLPKALALLEAYSPQWFLAYQKAKDTLTPEQMEKLERVILGRYRHIQFTSWQGEEVKALKLEQLRLEDQLFGLRMEIKDSGGIDSAKAKELKPKMREKVRELVRLRMQERELHLKHLQGMIKFETEQLEKDRQKEEELVDERLEDEIKNDGSSLVPNRSERRGGPFGPRGDRPGEKPGEKPDSSKPKN